MTENKVRQFFRKKGDKTQSTAASSAADGKAGPTDKRAGEKLLAEIIEKKDREISALRASTSNAIDKEFVSTMLAKYF